MEIGCFYLSVKMAVSEGKYKTEDEAIDVAYNAGIRCFDLESTFLTDGTTPEALAEKIKKHGMYIASVYGYIKCPYKTEQQRNESIAHMKREIDYAKRAGSPNFMIVPQKPDDYSDKDNALFRDFIKELFRRCAEYAISIGVQPTVENFSNLLYPYSSYEDIRELLDTTDGLKYTYDSGNFYYVDLSEIEGARLFAKDTVHTHLKDIHETDVPSDTHYGRCVDNFALGEGWIDNKKALRILHDAGYNGAAIIEVCSDVDMFERTINSVEYLKNVISDIKGETA
jgi:sugar phosphate isomerase/epimerase